MEIQRDQTVECERRWIEKFAASGAEKVAETMQQEREGIGGVSMEAGRGLEPMNGMTNGAKSRFLGL